MKKIILASINYLSAPFSWSKWVDIDTFSFGGDAYLLQGKVNNNSNAKRFRVTRTRQWYRTADIGSLPMQKLESAGIVKQSLTNQKHKTL